MVVKHRARAHLSSLKATLASQRAQQHQAAADLKDATQQLKALQSQQRAMHQRTRGVEEQCDQQTYAAYQVCTIFLHIHTCSQGGLCVY